LEGDAGVDALQRIGGAIHGDEGMPEFGAESVDDLDGADLRAPAA
jgi:hypothetical protein